MNKYIYIAALAAWSSALAQEQNPNRAQAQPNQPRPVQPQPGLNQPASSAATDPAPKTAVDRAAEGLGNIITDWRLEDLPPAVQKTVREHSGGQQIADIDRESRTGRTVWEVEFDKAGQNTEIHVADDGTLMPEGDRVAGRTTDNAGRPVQPGERPSATGTAAGTQTGRSGAALALGTQWEDLPKQIQDKATQFGGKEKIADIDREDWKGQTAYEVEFRRQGRNLEVHFAEDGTVLESNDPTVAPQGAASRTETGRAPSTQPGQPQPASPAQPEIRPQSNPAK
jgi:uncharacterized membrane protein YkoI